MKYIVYTINYNTLSRAMRYVDEVWGKENTIIIFAEIDCQMPLGLRDEYNTVRIDGKNREKYNGIIGNLLAIRIAKKSWYVLDNLLKNISEDFVFVVFRDNEPQEATLIDRLCSKYPERANICIMEEGIGIYSQSRPQIKAELIKKIMYKLTGISSYALTHNPQGMHPYIKKIICQSPTAVRSKLENSMTEIEQMIDIFTEEHNNHFVGLCLAGIKKKRIFDYVFLTIPILDMPANRFNGTTAEYMSRVELIVKTASKYGQVLIKPHPRDMLDYSVIANDNVYVCSREENLIPYECLATWYGYPQMISAFSSASINSKNKKESFYVSDIIGIKDGGSDLPCEFYRENNIICCRTMEDFEKHLR